MKTIKYKNSEDQKTPHAVKISSRAVKFLELLDGPTSYISGGFRITKGGSTKEIIDFNDMKSIVELIDKGVLKLGFKFTNGINVYQKQEVVEIK